MKTKTFLVLLLTTTLLLTSCAGLTQSVDLDGTSWVLVSYAGQSPIPGSAPTLIFEDGRVGGKASCNSFGGDVQISGDRIVFGDLLSTLMACLSPEGIMEQEQAYLQLLGAVESFAIEGGQLVLTTSGGKTLIFDSAE